MADCIGEHHRAFLGGNCRDGQDFIPSVYSSLSVLGYTRSLLDTPHIWSPIC